MYQNGKGIQDLLKQAQKMQKKLAKARKNLQVKQLKLLLVVEW